MARQGQAGQGLARHGGARRGTARHGKAWHGKAWQGMEFFRTAAWWNRTAEGVMRSISGMDASTSR
jgi:hypothetical protein